MLKYPPFNQEKEVKRIIVILAAAMVVCAKTVLGGEVPEVWNKARTLMGVATRATANPLQGTFVLKCGNEQKGPREGVRQADGPRRQEEVL